MVESPGKAWRRVRLPSWANHAAVGKWYQMESQVVTPWRNAATAPPVHWPTRRPPATRGAIPEVARSAPDLTAGADVGANPLLSAARSSHGAASSPRSRGVDRAGNPGRRAHNLAP